MSEVAHLMRRREKQMHDEVMEKIKRRLAFDSYLSFKSSEMHKCIDAMLSSYRKKIYSTREYGDFCYGSCYHQYSSILNSIIYHIECLLEDSMVQWYHLPSKRAQIVLYRTMLSNTKEYYLAMETDHIAFIPPEERKPYRYDEGE